MKILTTKRMLSALLALNCAAAAVPAFAVNAEDAQEGVIYSSDFEDGDVSAWTNRGTNDTTEISASEDNASSGTKSLCASGRSKSWNGPAFRLDDKCEPGVAYLVSAKAMGQWYTGLTLSFQYTDAAGEQHYENLASLNGNGWQEVTDLKVSYTEEMTDVYVYFEGGSDNIYIDDFTIKEAPVFHPQSDIVSLKDVYANNFKIGTATTTKELAPASTKELILKHFNSITAGNELKPDAILDQNACLEMAAAGDDENPQVSLASARSILNFARDNNIPVRGHVLVWHQQTPEWFFKENYETDGEWVSKEKMLVRLENYIKNVFAAVKEEYPDVDFYAWDVVNECLKDDGKPRDPGFPAQANGYQSSPWVQIFGDNSFIKPAFEFAKKYAPEGTKLYYNDYNEYMPGKREAIVALTEEINADGHYIDGIGMQSHLDARSGSDAFPSVNVYEKALDMFCNTGLDVQVTELDATVNSNDLFEEQAQYYSDIMDAIMRHEDKISAVVFWGTTDDQSWRASKYPLLFNEDYTAKPAFDAIVDGLEPVTPTEPETTEPASETETTEPEASETEATETETETEPETQDSSAPAKEILWGDADDNGEVDILDVITINKAVMGKETLSEEQIKNADVNLNGKPDANDAMTVLKLIVGMIQASELPISE